MNVRLLKQVGEALYGPRWQSELARELNVADRTVRRWVFGAHPIPGDAWPKLARFCDLRRIRLARVAADIRRGKKEE